MDKNFHFLIAAYSAIWILLAFYFYKLGSKVDKLGKRISKLEEDEISRKR